MTSTNGPNENMAIRGRNVMTYHRWVLVLIAVLWVLPNWQSVSTMNYDWDAAQYSLGTIEYNLAKHQPHSPGYPLWVLSLRFLQPLTHGAPLAQTVLGFLFTVGSLFCFSRLVRFWFDDHVGNSLTLMLAFSPVVQLYAFAQSTYPVDLLASTLLGWLGWRMWQGDVRALQVALPAAAFLMGFRPSGVVLLAPMLLVAAWRGFGRQPKLLVVPVVAALVLVCMWFWPMTQSTGGFEAWSRLNQQLFQSTAGRTSILLGASLNIWLSILARLLVILCVALIPLVGIAVSCRGRKSSLPWVFLALWAVPGLLFVSLVHFAKPGYLMVVLPPLFIALGASRPSKQAVSIGLVVALIVVLMPYSSLPINKVTRAVALSTPYAAQTVAQDNHDLRLIIEGLKPKGIVGDYSFREMAPNVRSVEYDFRNLSGDGPVVYYVKEGGVGPQGTKLVYESRGFGLWQ